MTATLILLHPLGVDHRFWDPVVAQLPDALGAVVVPDLLGHGSAPLPPERATVADFADAVEKELAEHDRVTLVGVSLGGLVAQVLGARRPEWVERLVLADTVAVYPKPMQSMWRRRAVTVRSEGLQAVVEPTEALWFSDAFRRDAAVSVAEVRRMLLAADPEGYARTCAALADADTSDLVASIIAPVLVACGQHDAQPFRDATDWFVRTLPDATMTWLPGGHANAFEQPKAFADALAGFLR